jgi:hypothetical protein
VWLKTRARVWLTTRMRVQLGTRVRVGLAAAAFCVAFLAAPVTRRAMRLCFLPRFATLSTQANDSAHKSASYGGTL